MYDFNWKFDYHWKRDGIPWFTYGPDQPNPVNGLIYNQAKLSYVRKKLAGVSKAAYLQAILDHILEPGMSPQQKVETMNRFVQDAMFHNPLEQPMEPGAERYAEHYAHEQLPRFAPIDDPQYWLGDVIEAHELLELHDGRCGHQAQLLAQLFRQAGFQARVMQMVHHRITEVFYDDGWHYCDPDIFKHGVMARKPDGTLPSAQWMIDPANVYAADALPPDGVIFTPEQARDTAGNLIKGYIGLSFTGGEVAFYSCYLGAPADYPPAVPVLLPPRLRPRAVTLSWEPSAHKDADPPRYDVDVYMECGSAPVAMWRDLEVTSVEVYNLAPGQYRWAVRATDIHRKLNPATWYYPAEDRFAV